MDHAETTFWAEFLLLAIFAGAYYPPVFLSGCVVALIYDYLIRERALHPSWAKQGGSLAPELPSQNDFFSGGLQRPATLIDDNCIICRDKLITPAQLSCGHTFCEECIMERLRRGYRRCPQCTHVLFRKQTGGWEEIVKLEKATTIVALLLNMLNLYPMYHEMSWGRISADVVYSSFQFVELDLVVEKRRLYGAGGGDMERHRGSYGKAPRFLQELATDKDELETMAALVSGFGIGIEGIWMIDQALLIGRWLSNHYLWKFLREL